MAKTAGSIVGSRLERLVEAWLLSQDWKVHRAAATGFHRFQKKGGGEGFAVKSHDLFGVFDILACKIYLQRLASDPLGVAETLAIQTTSPATRSVRREKILAAGPWPRSWRVVVLCHRSRREGRRTDHWFEMQELLPEGWGLPSDHVVDVPGLEEWRSERSRAKKRARKEAES